MAGVAGAHVRKGVGKIEGRAAGGEEGQEVANQASRWSR